MPSLRGRLANVAIAYGEEILAILRSHGVRIIGSEFQANHVVVYLEDNQENLDRAREAFDRYNYGYISSYTYDKLTLVIS